MYRSIKHLTQLALLVLLLALALIAGTVQAQDANGDHLSIPAIEVDAPIVDVFVRQFSNGDVTWDVSDITMEVGFFVGTASPFEGGNTVLGGHSELAGREPGVFYRLDELALGDEIFLTLDGHVLRYVVTDRYVVAENDMRPIMPTAANRLTIMTCDINSYHRGEYLNRLVIVATPA